MTCDGNVICHKVMTGNVNSIGILVVIFDYVIGKCILDYFEDKMNQTSLVMNYLKVHS